MYSRELLGGCPAAVNIGYFGKSAATAASTLLDGLVSYWPLDEESGTRADVVGSNDLTDNNTVGFAAGVNSNAASFVAASNESLSRASVSATADLTIAFWLKAPSLGADTDILGLFTGWPSTGAFHFRASPSVMSFLVGSGAGFAQASPAAAVAVNDGQWHLFIGTFTDADKTARLYYDGDNLGITEGNLGAGISTAPHTFFIGAGLLGACTEVVDEVALWSRVLTADERAELWNSGAGKFYPFPS